MRSRVLLAARAMLRATPHPVSRLLVLARRFAPLCLFALLPGPLSAEPITLTDNQGRSISAEPLSLGGDFLKIRRSDGQEFTLDIRNLAEADQAKIREWAAAQPAPAPEEPKKEEPTYVPDMKKVTLAMSRYKGDSVVIYKSTSYTHKHQRIGYSFSVTNRNIRPISNVRVEYNLFAATYAGEVTSSVVAGAIDYPVIDFNRTETLKGKTAEVCQSKGINISTSGGELRGIWVKLLVDGVIISEVLPPEDLRNEVRWVVPRPDM